MQQTLLMHPLQNFSNLENYKLNLLLIMLCQGPSKNPRAKFELKVNPTLHGLQLLVLYMGGGTMCPPLLNASNGHFWVQKQ